ncbi:methyltransferase domain-containing protein [Advenella alkanexedens]|jgi:chemotaxis protein methyltransferase CheR|uniref:Chemotaxis protein methyltransferase n=1 Tax=Advenella alkanexedens TaxID=1481665 RepID=A0ABS6NPT0_9BURK|nr:MULTISPECIES: CheR family methyltransferase [Advenella]MBV4397636.1 methyltransferase domain-containing protein [Advenella alkanexedens]MDD3759014.1 methyltransferase domain-containing protein [Advenella sp.]NLN68278.1 methyltransferase domain-containing protein [Alcaligenaceae bacterium]
MDALTRSAWTETSYKRALKMLHDRSGIIVGEHKMKSSERLLEGLRKEYGFVTIDDFLDSLGNNKDHSGWPAFINCFTINHTAFFREPHHFEILAKYIEKHRTNCAIWCASCSTGEEPYSIAMVLNEIVGEQTPCPRIVATDIDGQAIQRAKAGIYSIDKLTGISEERLRRHFLKGNNKFEGKAKVKPALCDRIEFSELNLMSFSWPKPAMFDVVFCRNTMIYFDHETQVRLVANFARSMKPGGLLFIGHSETLASTTDQFTLLGQTVYQRNNR